RRRHTRFKCDWSSDVCSSDLDDNARCFGMLLDGRAQETGVKRRGSDATLLLIYNAHFDVVNFTLPAVPEGHNWLALIDTNQPDEIGRASCRERGGRAEVGADA